MASVKGLLKVFLIVIFIHSVSSEHLQEPADHLAQQRQQQQQQQQQQQVFHGEQPLQTLGHYLRSAQAENLNQPLASADSAAVATVNGYRQPHAAAVESYRATQTSIAAVAQQQPASLQVQHQITQQQQQQQQHNQQVQQIQQSVHKESASSYQYQLPNSSPLYIGHNPFIEILRPHSYADDNIVTLNLSHSHIYEIDSESFVGQRFEHIDLSNNKLGLIHSRSFRIGPNHSRHNHYDSNGTLAAHLGKPSMARRPPPTNPKSLTIDLSHNPAIVALSGAFDHIDVPNCLLNFTNSTVELKFGAFKKYFKEHPGHMIDVDTVDCCEQEWLLGYKHNFVSRTHCEHDASLYLSRATQQTIIDSCIAHVKSGRRSMTIQGPSIIHQVGAVGTKGSGNLHAECQNLTYLILGGTAMILTSLSIYIIIYMFSLKAAFVYQLQRNG